MLTSAFAATASQFDCDGGHDWKATQLRPYHSYDAFMPALALTLNSSYGYPGPGGGRRRAGAAATATSPQQGILLTQWELPKIRGYLTLASL